MTKSWRLIVGAVVVIEMAMMAVVGGVGFYILG